MNARRLALLLAALSGCVGLSSARADVIRTFAAQGVFASGATLGGTIAIDTTLGTIAAADLTVTHYATRLFSAVQSSAIAPMDGVDLTIGKQPAGYPALLLHILTPTLVQYAGGPLASATDPAPFDQLSAIRRRRHHAYGTLIDARLIPIPEPASLALLATGALLLLLRPRAQCPA